MIALFSLLTLLFLLPQVAAGETLQAGIDQLLSSLDTTALSDILADADPFAATGGFTATVGALARGEVALDLGAALTLVKNRMLTALQGTLWRLTRLAAPALLWSLLRRLCHVEGKAIHAGQTVCQLCVCIFLTQDLTEHIALARSAITRMNSGMQALFPMLLTMMAAVGGSAGSAIMQPAVVASASTLTTLLTKVTVPLSIAAAVLTMLCHLGEGMKLQRLTAFVLSCATWTLGVTFTAFIAVLSTRAVTAAALDGVTLRVSKYAIRHLVPVVGGLFADTVDTLVGAGVLVQGALGVTGLMLIAAYALTPLCQTLAASLLYRLSAALLQPVSDGPLSGCIHDFGRVLMLLFIMQLCAAAMFLMLIAQLISVSGMTMMLR